MILFLLSVALLPAQSGRPTYSVSSATAPPAVYLPKDSPHLYRLFFYFHRNFDSWVQQQKGRKTPAEAQRIDQDVVRMFGLSSVQTLNALRTVSNSYSAELAAVDDQEKVHVNARAKLELSPIGSQLRAFEARRLEITSRGMTGIQTRLGPTEWTRFQKYINGPHRSSYSIVTARR